MSPILASLVLSLLTAASASLPSTEDAIPALRDGQWSDAVPVLESVVMANPYEGRALYYLGVARQRLGRHQEALDALRGALELGVNGTRSGTRAAHVALARSLAATGEIDAALDHLEEAWAHWGFGGLRQLLGDDDFAVLHDDPRLRALAGLDPQADAGDRDARWRADLAYFRRLLVVAHPEPFHSADATRWNAAADTLHRRIPQLNDREIVAGLMRLAASIGDGHTAVYPPVEGDLAWQLLPFYPVHLADGWYVAAATPENSDLAGAKILQAAGQGWPDLVDAAAEHLAADNVYTQRWLAGVGLQFADFYALSSRTADTSRIELVVETADGTRVRRQLEPTSVARDPNAHWAPADWVTAYTRVPRWLQDPSRLFHHEMLPDSRVVYARLLQTADGEEQALAEYGRELRSFVAKKRARALVLDLRLNNGGNANMARGFVNELLRIPGIEEPKFLAVLLGPRTFSATGYLLGMMEKHLDPILVGWPSGCRPVQYSSERSFRLPYSGLTGSISYELRVDGHSTDDRRPAFFPHHLVWPTGEDLRRGRDPVLETALEALR
jgi:hypothetical protein